ncbi:hypothetical protein ACNOYE_16520 [Nannocystaceae bacterium ST9]
MLFGLVLVSLVCSGPPDDVGGEPVDAVPVDAASVDAAPVIREPGAEAPSTPTPGGFGTVGNVTTESNVAAPPPEPEPEPTSKRATEIGGRVAVGYGQTDVRNAQAWDHRGAWLSGALQWFPYVTPRRRVFGVGIELGYSYQGLVRKRLPASTDAPFDHSKIQQHFVDVGLALLLRPHPAWFTIQPTGSIGFAFYGGNQLYARERHAELPGRSNALGVAAKLALCTAWDIVCVVGGYRWTDGLDARDLVDFADFQVPTGTWHVGLGLDILRIYARLNEGPSGR